MVERNVFEFDTVGLRERDFVSEISNFLSNDHLSSVGRVLVLYGLRRTGKTTGIEQAISGYKKKDECAFFEVTDADTIEDIIEKIIEKKRDGVSIICFDEITKAEGFVDRSAVLADVFAKEGVKILLTGTDSLNFVFAENDELLDRTLDINTTHIPLAEHCRVLGTDDIDDYIQYGGLMRRGLSSKIPVKDIATAKKYLDSAVSGNIVRSIKNSGRGSNLTKIPKHELISIIEKLVEIYSGSITIKNTESELKSATINYPVSKLTGMVDDVTIEHLVLNRENIVRDFANVINADAKINTKIDDKILVELESHLLDMDVLSVTPRTEFRYLEDSGWREMPTEFEYHIIQPAIKFFHLQAAKDFIETREYYSELKQKEKTFMSNKLEEKIFGDMTEQIVLFDTKSMLSKDKYLITKPIFYKGRNRCGEYDMLIYNKFQNSYYGFEIKHTTEPFSLQEKHLNDETLREIIDKNYGERKGASVLYRGNPFKSSTGTVFLNITDFSLAIEKYKDVELAMNELTNELPTINLEEYEKAKEEHPGESLEEKINRCSYISDVENILYSKNDLLLSELTRH